MADKMTYAQKFLYEKLEKRTLKNWCEANQVPYLICYKIACGKSVPTYSAICQLLPLIPVTDWFFFEDEQVPYPRVMLEKWNPEEISSFVRRHKHDYIETGKKYGTTESYARNLFVNYRARPTVTLIRTCALDGINPSDFFTAGDVNDDGNFYPDRGDVVLLSGKTILVLTKAEQNLLTHSLTGVCLENGVPNLNTLAAVPYIRATPKLLRKADAAFLEKALEQVRELFR